MMVQYRRKLFLSSVLMVDFKGCMVVELLDYRSQKGQESAQQAPQKTRVVLHPNPETLWADLCILNQRHGGKWTDREALEIEAKVLVNWHSFSTSSSAHSLLACYLTSAVP